MSHPPRSAGTMFCWIAVVWGLTLLVGGCTVTAVPAVTGTGVDHGLGPTRSLAVGQTTRIGLASTPSTGFGWAVDEEASSGLSCVHIRDEGFIGTDSGLVGAPGRRWWTITATAPGTARVAFAYQRAWERTQPPAEVRVYMIQVR
ncbi:MAG: protease inhibitor I42 family protein [Phycisphaerales bacterium]|nr:protease inhibitor I42 family protein [Phycisphaerales bacterium]